MTQGSVLAAPLSGLSAAFGLQLSHEATIDGQLRVPTMVGTGDPLLVYTNDSAVLWAAHWSSDLNGSDVISQGNNAGWISTVVILPNGDVIASGPILSSKSGGRQTVEIRNGDGSIFKQFDTLAALPADQCGIGGDGLASNIFVARYRARDGQCLWAKRMGCNEIANRDVYLTQTSEAFYDELSDTVVIPHNHIDHSSGGVNGRATSTFGIGETNTHDEPPVAIDHGFTGDSYQYWVARVELDANTGNFTGKISVTRAPFGLPPNDLNIPKGGERDGTLPLARGFFGGWNASERWETISAHALGAAAGGNATNAKPLSFNRDDPNQLTEIQPWILGDDNRAHMLAHYDVGSDGPSRILRVYEGLGVNGYVGETPSPWPALINNGVIYMSTRWDRTSGNIRFDSLVSGLAENSGFAENGLVTGSLVLTKVDDDGLSNPLVTTIVGRAGTGNARLGLVGADSNNDLICFLGMDGGRTNRLDPAGASQLDVSAPGAGVIHPYLAWLDGDDFAPLTVIQNHYCMMATGAAVLFTGTKLLDDETLIQATAVIDGTGVLDVDTAAQAIPAPAGGESIAFGYAIFNPTTRTLTSFSGNLFAASTTNTAAGQQTRMAQVFDARILGGS